MCCRIRANSGWDHWLLRLSAGQWPGQAQKIPWEGALVSVQEVMATLTSESPFFCQLSQEVTVFTVTGSFGRKALSSTCLQPHLFLKVK